VVTRAKKSIAAFKVREGMPIGAMVTLRGDRMYEFFDRLVSIVLPRVRDFAASRPSRSTDGAITRWSARSANFPRDRLLQGRQAERHERDHCDTARSDDQARSLLKHLGMPFRAN